MTNIDQTKLNAAVEVLSGLTVSRMTTIHTALVKMLADYGADILTTATENDAERRGIEFGDRQTGDVVLYWRKKSVIILRDRRSVMIVDRTA